MKYLVEQYAKDDSLFPRDPKQGAIVSQRLFFNACYLFPRFVSYAVYDLIKYILAKFSRNIVFSFQLFKNRNRIMKMNKKLKKLLIGSMVY